MKIGYARVSSIGQNLDTQIQKLKEYGCEEIFMEKRSGKDRKGRIELERALEYVRSGDEFIVAKLDRVARSVIDLNNILHLLNEKNVSFKALNTDIDTSTSHGKLLFNILGSIAEFERELIKERQKDGIENAKTNGVKFGRKKKINDSMIADFIELQNEIDGNFKRIHTNQEVTDIINNRYNQNLSRISYLKAVQNYNSNEN